MKRSMIIFLSLGHKCKQFFLSFPLSFFYSFILSFFNSKHSCFFNPDRKFEIFEIQLGRIADHIRNFH